MKPFTIIALCIFQLMQFCFPSSAQPTPDWVARYNSGQQDCGRAMVTDADDNIYVTGRSEAKRGNTDIVTIKYNSAGSTIWTKRYNGPGNAEDQPFAINIDAAGNVYVTGRSIGNGTNFDFVTIKYDNGGGQQWVSRTTGAGYDVARDVKVDGSGNVYVTGYSNGNLVSGFVITTIKYNSAGGLVWADHYNGLPDNGQPSAYEEGNSIAFDALGNAYVTGRGAGIVTIKYQAGESLVREWVRTCGGSNGQKVLVDAAGDIIVTGWGSVTAKYTSGGNLVWQTTYPGIAEFQDMALDGLGNIYVTGYGRDNGTSDDYRTVKYNTGGVQQWSESYDGSKNGIDLARALALDADGNVFVTGYSTVNDGSRNGKIVYATLKYDNAGVEQWQVFYDGEAFAIAAGSDGSVYVTGQSAIKSNYDMVTIKYPADAPAATWTKTPVPAIYPGTVRLSNYPNPFYNATTIEYEVTTESRVRLTITDLMGNDIATLVNELRTPGVYRVNFQAERLSPGAYFYRLQSAGNVVVKRMVVMR